MVTAKPKKFGPRLTVSLTGSDYSRLSAIADQSDVSVSWVVRHAIQEFLARHSSGSGPQPSVHSPRAIRAPEFNRPHEG
jgi:hypothetical protein